MNNNRNIDFKDNLRKLRIAKQWSQSDLAKKSYTSPNVVSWYECGKKRPQYRTIEKLCQALDCSATELLGF